MSLSSSSALSAILRQSHPRPSASRALQSCRYSRQWRGNAAFHTSPALRVVKPYLLADIGEGITECQIIQWFVQPGARVAQFDKICEVQSDKAAVEITSRFDGVIKKLHYEADEMARVGKPLVDIDIQSDISPEDEALTKPAENEASAEGSKGAQSQDIHNSSTQSSAPEAQPSSQSFSVGGDGGRNSLATPAVRHLSKELDIKLSDVTGSGRDGRVLKEDLQKYASSRNATDSPSQPSSVSLGKDRVIPLVGIQNQMFKTMTKSLSIPHFLYTDSVDFTSLTSLRRRINSKHTPATSSSTDPSLLPQKLSPLPFIIKAVSLALTSFPAINAHLDTTDPHNPTLTHRASHNIGVAIDTPHGLVVPVVQHVQAHSIRTLAAELARLAALARANRLGPGDLAGATFSVSNIGSIGGGVVAPVIVGPQVAILGVGKARAVPAFEGERVVRREESVFSWSADHRAVDGATVARAAEMVKGLLEDVEGMAVVLR